VGILDNFFKPSFARGIHPAPHKGTLDQPIKRMPFPRKLVLPLAQHIGKPALPLVGIGEEVVRGQVIARAEGTLSSPIHAPADGVIEAITPMPVSRGQWSDAIVLRVYEASTQEVRCGQPQDVDAMDHAQLIAVIQEIGMVGLGGATFPSHAKLNVPADKQVHTLIANGCECEPYLTCDYKLMREWPQELIAGIRIAMRASGIHLGSLLAPLIVLGFIASLFLIVLNERIIPYAHHEQRRDDGGKEDMIAQGHVALAAKDGHPDPIVARDIVERLGHLLQRLEVVGIVSFRTVERDPRDPVVLLIFNTAFDFARNFSRILEKIQGL